MIAIFLFVVAVIVLGGYAIVAAYITYCAWRAFRAFADGQARVCALWLVASSAPFLHYAVNQWDFKLVEDVTAISETPRKGIDGSYPGTLIVRGNLAEPAIASLLLAHDFDEIYVLPDRASASQARVHKAVHSQACIGAAQAWLERKQGKSNTQNSKIHQLLETLKSCVQISEVEVSDGDLPSEAILLLMGRATTLREKGSARPAGESIEVRLLSGGRDDLVDYWEHLYKKRQTSPFCFAAWPSCRQRDLRGSSIDALSFLLKALGREF